MDPKNAKSQGKSPAEERVDSLVSGKEGDKPDPKVGSKAEATPEPGQASQRLQEQKRAEAKAAITGKPVLTEKQRIEARRKRQAKKRRPVTGNPLSKGFKATAFEIQRTALFLGRSVLSGLDSLKPAGESVLAAIAWLARRVGHGLVLIASLIGRLTAAVGALLLALDRRVNTRQAFTLVALVGAGLLVASQFQDYRAIEIGQPGYSAVQEITRAPRSEVKTPIDTHSFLLVIAGIAAFGAAVLSAISRKRISGLVLAAAGGLTLVVAIAIDLPAGLDAEVAELSYSGVNAILLSGFWIELAAGAVLLVSGLGLMLEPSRRAAASPGRSSEGRRSEGRSPENRDRAGRSAEDANMAGGQA